MKSYLSLMKFLVIALLFGACSKDEDNEPSFEDKSIVFVYAQTKETSDNQKEIITNYAVSGKDANYYEEAKINGTVKYKWWRADDTSGKNIEAISGASFSNYIITSEDIGKFIRAEIAIATTINKTFSSNYVGPIEE